MPGIWQRLKNDLLGERMDGWVGGWMEVGRLWRVEEEEIVGCEAHFPNL